MRELEQSINALDLAQNIASPDEMFDVHCDPANPVKVQFNNISAAAYHLKGGNSNSNLTCSAAIMFMRAHRHRDHTMHEISHV
jgi:hypothetical protein